MGFFWNAASSALSSALFLRDPGRPHMPLFLGPLPTLHILGPMDQTPPGKSSGILGSSHLADLGATSTSGQPDSLLDPAMPKPRDRLRHCQPALWGPFFLILLFLLFSILSFPRFLCQSLRRSLFPWFPLLPRPVCSSTPASACVLQLVAPCSVFGLQQHLPASHADSGGPIILPKSPAPFYYSQAGRAVRL